MDNFSLNKALDHFNINRNEFMEIYNKYHYHQITIEQHYAKEKVLPEIEKWLSEHEHNTIIMKLKETACYAHNDGWCQDCNEIRVGLGYWEKICYEPNLTYDWGEDAVYLEEHEVDFENISKLIFEDYRGNEVKQLII
jgi:hypothetical protein